jgi:hypothetical protein
MAFPTTTRIVQDLQGYGAAPSAGAPSRSTGSSRENNNNNFTFSSELHQEGGGSRSGSSHEDDSSNEDPDNEDADDTDETGNPQAEVPNNHHAELAALDGLSFGMGRRVVVKGAANISDVNISDTTSLSDLVANLSGIARLSAQPGKGLQSIAVRGRGLLDNEYEPELIATLVDTMLQNPIINAKVTDSARDGIIRGDPTLLRILQQLQNVGFDSSQVHPIIQDLLEHDDGVLLVDTLRQVVRECDKLVHDALMAHAKFDKDAFSKQLLLQGTTASSADHTALAGIELSSRTLFKALVGAYWKTTYEQFALTAQETLITGRAITTPGSVSSLAIVSTSPFYELFPQLIDQELARAVQLKLGLVTGTAEELASIPTLCPQTDIIQILRLVYAVLPLRRIEYQERIAEFRAMISAVEAIVARGEKRSVVLACARKLIKEYQERIKAQETTNALQDAALRKLKSPLSKDHGAAALNVEEAADTKANRVSEFTSAEVLALERERDGLKKQNANLNKKISKLDNGGNPESRSRKEWTPEEAAAYKEKMIARFGDGTCWSFMNATLRGDADATKGCGKRCRNREHPAPSAWTETQTGDGQPETAQV